MNALIAALLLSSPVSLSAQSRGSSKQSSAIILKEFSCEELNSDGWALLPRLQVSASANFTLQDELIHSEQLADKFLEYALLCPSHKRYILLEIDPNASTSAMIQILQSLKTANDKILRTPAGRSGVPITVIIPIDHSKQMPTFPNPLPKPAVAEKLPPPPQAP